MLTLELPGDRLHRSRLPQSTFPHKTELPHHGPEYRRSCVPVRPGMSTSLALLRCAASAHLDDAARFRSALIWWFTARTVSTPGRVVESPVHAERAASSGSRTRLYAAITSSSSPPLLHRDVHEAAVRLVGPCAVTATVVERALNRQAQPRSTARLAGSTAWGSSVIHLGGVNLKHREILSVGRELQRPRLCVSSEGRRSRTRPSGGCGGSRRSACRKRRGRLKSRRSRRRWILLRRRSPWSAPLEQGRHAARRYRSLRARRSSPTSGARTSSVAGRAAPRCRGWRRRRRSRALKLPVVVEEVQFDDAESHKPQVAATPIAGIVHWIQTSEAGSSADPHGIGDELNGPPGGDVGRRVDVQDGHRGRSASTHDPRGSGVWAWRELTGAAPGDNPGLPLAAARASGTSPPDTTQTPKEPRSWTLSGRCCRPRPHELQRWPIHPAVSLEAAAISGSSMAQRRPFSRPRRSPRGASSSTGVVVGQSVVDR